MTASHYVPRPRKLLPQWMLSFTDRVMDYYTKRYLHCDPVILQRPPEPDGLLRMNHQNAPNVPGWCECPVDQVNPVVNSPIDRVPGGVR